MVALEKAGMPVVGIVARDFVRAWQSCVEGWGQPSTAFIPIPHATTGGRATACRKAERTRLHTVRRTRERWGAAREVHAGSGYWSEDSLVQVLGMAEVPTAVWVRWPGGRTLEVNVPSGATEVVITAGSAGK